MHSMIEKLYQPLKPDWVDSKYNIRCEHMSIEYEAAQFLAGLIAYIKPHIVLDLGTGAGISTAVMASEMPKGGIIYTCDIIKHNKLITWPDFDIHIKFYNIDSLTFLSEFCKGLIGKINFVLIDTEHTKEQLYAELKLVIPLMADNSLIVCHDTNYIKELRIPIQEKKEFFFIDYGRGFALLKGHKKWKQD